MTGVAPVSAWPGSPFPLGPTWDGEGTNFSLFSENAERVELCLFDDGRPRDARRADRAHRVPLARLPARGRAGAALRLPRPRRLRPEPRPPLQPRQAPDRPVREGDRGPDPLRRRRACSRTPPTATTSSPTAPTTRPRSRSAWSSTQRSTGRATGRSARRGTRRSSTRRTSAASRSSTRACRTDLRGTYAGLASDEAIAHLRSLGVTAVELLPIHHIADEEFLHGHGLTNYWGYSTVGFLAPHAALRGDRHARRAGARVQGDGQGAPPRGHRGDPRRRLQPHRRGQPPRPDALVQGRRQRLVLPARTRRPERTTWTSRAPATASTRCTRACCG